MSPRRIEIGAPFSLTDHHGRPVSDRTYRGRHMMIFFGFTHCRKVCPETLGKLSRVLDRLGSRAAELAPLYITVDPDRDDPEAMKAFLTERYPHFTGLTGPREELEALRAGYRVFAQRAPDEEDPEGYAMPHSALVYVTDRDGRYQMHFNDGADEDDIFEALSARLEAERSSGG